MMNAVQLVSWSVGVAKGETLGSEGERARRSSKGAAMLTAALPCVSDLNFRPYVGCGSTSMAAVAPCAQAHRC
jgi:hypothetical protein